MIDKLLDMWLTILLWTALFSTVFPLLAMVMPCNPGQKPWRKDALTDLIYCFIIPLLNRFGVMFLFITGAYFIFYGQSLEEVIEYTRNGYGPVATLPTWLQIAIHFIVADIMLYWLHRMFHGKQLWKYHAIHHSSTQVDWLSTYRFHPVNSWLSFSLVDAALLLAGFPPAISAALAGFNTVYSAMVHANLNWTFGPFKYVFASPVFHRWHHTSQAEGMDKNFAPTFPILDVIFGTFYMPEKRMPETYGVHGSNIPHSFIGQMIWPFRSK
ncbi:MAG: sterol desaturase family protein [Alphaproteobacteria bacterium]